MFNVFEFGALDYSCSVKHCFNEEALFLKFESFSAQNGFDYYVEHDGFCVVFFGLSEEQDVYISKVVDEMILELYVK